MKASHLKMLLDLVTYLPERQLREIADARYWMTPDCFEERVVLFVAAGQQQWREECQSSM
jgi:hypothetical protein